MIAEEPEGHKEDPLPAANAVPQQINEGSYHVVQEVAEPEAEHGEMQPGDYITERLVRNRRPPSTLNGATCGNPYVSSLQASNANQPYRFPSTFCTSNSILSNSIYSSNFASIPLYPTTIPSSITCLSNLFQSITTPFNPPPSFWIYPRHHNSSNGYGDTVLPSS